MATQEQRKAETRQRLLDAAAALFAERGVDAVSIDAVAEAADRTSGALYAHFGSKAGLLNALLESLVNETASVMEAELSIDGNP
ncbi:MAG TPA: helix-turn-helix domain-containing protein, partial [Dermatophilaceae bacterium]